MVPLEGDPGRAARPVTPNVVPVPPAVAGERSGLAEAVVGRLVEPGVDAAAAARRVRRPSPRPRGRARCRRAPARASRDDLQAEGLGRPARLARRPASRRGSRAHRHRRSRRCARRRVGGHGSRLRGQSVSPPPVFLCGEPGRGRACYPASSAFDTHASVKALTGAGASEEIAVAVVNVAQGGRCGARPRAGHSRRPSHSRRPEAEIAAP